MKRDEENEAELNTGLDEDIEEDIDIGWGALNHNDNPNHDEEVPDEDIDLEVDPFANNHNVTLDELKSALGNLTLDQEINGDSSSLPLHG